MRKYKALKKSSSYRRAKVDHLPQGEWNFQKVPDHLVHHCWLWEFCRELYLQNEELREAVEAYWLKMDGLDEWRRHVECETDWPKVSGGVVFTEENIRWREPVLDDQKSAGPKWRVRTRLELIELGDRLQHLPGWDNIKGYASTHDEVISRLMDFDETYGLEKDLDKYLGIASVDETDSLIVCVDWHKSDDDLISEFRSLLEKNRPTPLEKSRKQGKARQPEKNELRALGALRLLRHYGTQPNVMADLLQRKKMGEQLTVPYSEPSNWSAAKRTANQALIDLVLIVRNTK
jgi:hypothetical protein